MQHSDGLVHFRREEFCFLVHLVVFQQLWHKFQTGVFGVSLHGECGERQEVDAISLFESGEVGIA